MFIFRHGSRRTAQLGLRGQPNVRPKYASRIEIPRPAPPFPVVESCPAPTCQCREMPGGLEIEREQNINGSMAAYAEQLLLSSGRNDWKSKIEEDDEAVLVRQLKSFLGRGGKYNDPYHNVMITNSSFKPTTARSDYDELSLSPDPTSTTSAFLFPSFQYVPAISAISTDSASVESFIKAFVLPSRLHQSHDRLTRAQTNALLRQPEMQQRFVGVRKINEIVVLICGHGGRDVRCGTLGPILKQEFEENFKRQNIELLQDPPPAVAVEADTAVGGYTPTARVGLISHIGGHKWAGNVIIYIPPSFAGNDLAGKGIWYGRVEPGHVEGIFAKTILEGKVIKDLFRGGIDQDRQILRL